MELTELKAVCEDMFEIKEAVKVIDDRKKVLTTRLNELKNIVLVEMNKNEMSNFKSGKMQLIKVDKKSVKIEDQNSFMDWLEDRGILRDSLNVTAAKATTIFNEEFEKAKEEQNADLLINGIPGLSKPETFQTISMRGK